MSFRSTHIPTTVTLALDSPIPTGNHRGICHKMQVGAKKDQRKWVFFTKIPGDHSWIYLKLADRRTNTTEGALYCRFTSIYHDIPIAIICTSSYTGWWFGTWILFFRILGIMIPTDKLIFFRGVGFKHQPVYVWSKQNSLYPLVI